MSRGVPLATIAWATLAACGGGSEDAVQTYLEATQDHDLPTLARLSVVPFPDPVLAWRIAGRAEIRTEPFRLPVLQKRLAEARRERDLHGNGGAGTPGERAQRVEALRREVRKEREAARKSLETWSAVDDFNGEVEVRGLPVWVQTASSAGERRFVITVKRYNLVSRNGGRRPRARWVVTRVVSGDRS